MIAAERQVRAADIVAAPDPNDDAFKMHARPQTIESWLGEKHGASE